MRGLKGVFVSILAIFIVFTSLSISVASTISYQPSKERVRYNGDVPVLTYHVVGQEFFKKIDEFVVSKANFEKQMKWLHDNKYHTITPDQLYNFITKKSFLPTKPIMLTFDDGNKDSYTTIFPILKKYNLTATMFIITNRIGMKRAVSLEDLEIMSKYGITIGSHTISHSALKKLNNSQRIKEIFKSKEILQRFLRTSINYFCYPFGSYNKAVAAIVKKAGYKAAFIYSTKIKGVKYGDDLFTIHRVNISGFDDLNKFKLKVQGSEGGINGFFIKILYYLEDIIRIFGRWL